MRGTGYEADCRSLSQLPDGRTDPRSEHGGCPVLAGTKWAANVWVWNGPRYGSKEAKAEFTKQSIIDNLRREATSFPEPSSGW